MYEPYTRQSLPSKEYRELLGSALCVFSSNNGFIIENIIHTSNAYEMHMIGIILLIWNLENLKNL